jgi:uncharacterized membrane protein YbhN (UPF0104 family)
MRFRWLRVLVQFGVGVAILLYLLRLADESKVFLILLTVSPVNIFIASIFFIIASIFVALALYIPIKSIEGSAPIDKVILGSFAGQLLSDVTPVRSGYFATPLIIKGLCNIPIEKGIIGVLVTGVVNSFAKVVLSVIALAYFLSFLPLDPMIINAIVFGVLLLLGGGFLLLIALIEKRTLKLLIFFEKVPIIKNVVQKIAEVFGKIQEGEANIKRQLPKAFLLILLSMIANALALQLISSGLGFRSVGLVEFVLIAALAGSLMYVPLTIAGLGVQETGYVLLLTLLGMPFEKAVAFALLARALFTGTDIIGLPVLIKVGFRSMKQKKLD